MTCMLVIRADNMNNKKLKMELKNHIMGLEGYPQYLPVSTKLINKYIT